MTSPFAYEWLYAVAEQRPDAPCIGGPAGWTSYGVLAERTQKLAGSLLAAGVQPGEVVLSSLPDGPANVAFTLAAQSVGACVAELNKELSPAALRLFEHVSRQRKGLAVAQARDGICTVCHVRLRPQVFNEVRRNESLIQCESCLRILYYSPTTAPNMDPPQAS